MTKRERRAIWRQVGRNQEAVEHLKGSRFFWSNKAIGLCGSAWNNSPNKSYFEKDSLQEQLRGIHNCDNYWFALNPKNAGLRALFAYFMAEGMAEDD